jgi:arylsulfatase A-like enzyme
VRNDLILQLWPVLALSLAACTQISPSVTSAPSPPDVVLITVDTWRADRLGLHGSPRATSPWLEQLASSAVVFDEAIATSSWTWPSMVSIATGLMPSQHGAILLNRTLKDEHTTLAEVFAEAGYRTLFVGSNHYLEPPDCGYQQGFGRYAALGGGPWSRLRPELLTALNDPVGPPAAPTFLHVHLFDPHCPFAPEDAALDQVRLVPLDGRPGCDEVDPLCGQGRRAPLLELMAELPGREARACFLEPMDSDLARPLRPTGSDDLEGWTELGVDWPDILDLYDAELRETDQILAEIEQLLTERGLWREAWVAITGDHGEEFGEHGRVGHGANLTTETVRVPLLIRPPAGDSQQALRVADPVSLVDLAPTLASVAGVAAPPEWAGRDLLGLLAARAAGTPLSMPDVGSELGNVRLMVGEGHRVYVDRHIGRHLGAERGDPKHGHEREFHVFEASDVYDRVDLLDPARPPAVQGRAAELADRLWRSGPKTLRKSEIFPPETALQLITQEQLEQLRALGYVGGDPLGQP